MSDAGDGVAPDRRVVLATRNAHKVEELRQILADVLARTGLELVGLDAFEGLEDVAETGVTFDENALHKARCAVEATGLPAIADDSGLAVDVLGGFPGVLSARWSGPFAQELGISTDEANNRLLLAQLADVPPERRAAGFVCAAALVTPDGEEVVRVGHCRGRVAQEPRGDHGFGYDPLLVRPDGRTLAEHTPEEKNAISHRGLAFRDLAADVERLLG